MTHAYQGLSPDLVIAAIESLGLQVRVEPFALNSYENRVFQFQDDDLKGWIIKFYRPYRWSDASIREEHAFIDTLASSGVAAAPARRDRKGESLHYVGAFRFAIFPRLGGQAPELDNPGHLFALGQLVGRLHRVGSQGHFTHRPRLDVHAGIASARRRVIDHATLSRQQVRAYLGLCDSIDQALAKGRIADLAQIRCHGDCHLGNLLGRDSDFALVDLDDCQMAPAIQDLWMLLPMENGPEWQAQLSELREGYEEEFNFPDDQLSSIEGLRAYRLIRHAAWIAERWDDPAFPRAFPWFGDEGYWDSHLRQLEQQKVRIEKPLWIA